MQKVSTLKQVANELNISEAKAQRIKQKIENNEFPGVPRYMVWGTGNKKAYILDTFKRYLKQ